jgi:hypothetical protein
MLSPKQEMARMPRAKAAFERWCKQMLTPELIDLYPRREYVLDALSTAMDEKGLTLLDVRRAVPDFEARLDTAYQAAAKSARKADDED